MNIKISWGKLFASITLGLMVLVMPQSANAEMSENMEIILHSGGAGDGNKPDYELTPRYSETPITTHFRNGQILRVSSVKVVSNGGDSSKFNFRVFLKGNSLILGGTSTGTPGIIGVRIACITEGFADELVAP